ncbi:MAG: ABC transporter ATP-binding protein [Phycisphaeraceae bacterium]|nr:ABC transporter ATP-binding protein [Phycisphaerae bacterium]MBX3391513.1 ABC transporter ATP-binding protein [Phycisphaeraceae bacterium]
MIETINLTKRYGDLVALNNLNLTINEGDCFGFIGPNGAGKTTTIKILATLLKPSSGQANVAGLTIGYQNRQIRPMIGYVPDFMGAYEDMVVTEYLEFFAASYAIHGDQRKKVIRDVLELTDLSYKATAEVNSLSRGMQQRLSVARVLLHDPRVLLMDEPASGLDPRARIEMRELLKELRRMGKTILISSHILPELAELCNVVGIIERGQLLFSGTVDEIVRRAKLGHVLHVGVVDRHEQAVEALGHIPGVTRAALLQDGEGPGQPVNGGAKGRAGHAAGRIIQVSYDDQAGHSFSDIPNILINQGFRLTKFTEEPINLETAFMRLTKGMVQ